MLDADGDGKLTPEELTHDFDAMLLGDFLRVCARESFYMLQVCVCKGGLLLAMRGHIHIRNMNIHKHIAHTCILYIYICVCVCVCVFTCIYTHKQVPQQSNMHCIVSAIDIRESWMVTAYSKYTCAYTCRISNVWVNTRVGYEIFMYQYLLYAQMHTRICA